MIIANNSDRPVRLKGRGARIVIRPGVHDIPDARWQDLEQKYGDELAKLFETSDERPRGTLEKVSPSIYAAQAKANAKVGKAKEEAPTPDA